MLRLHPDQAARGVGTRDRPGTIGHQRERRHLLLLPEGGDRTGRLQPDDAAVLERGALLRLLAGLGLGLVEELLQEVAEDLGVAARLIGVSGDDQAAVLEGHDAHDLGRIHVAEHGHVAVLDRQDQPLGRRPDEDRLPAARQAARVVVTHVRDLLRAAERIDAIERARLAGRRDQAAARVRKQGPHELRRERCERLRLAVRVYLDDASAGRDRRSDAAAREGGECGDHEAVARGYAQALARRVHADHLAGVPGADPRCVARADGDPGRGRVQVDGFERRARTQNALTVERQGLELAFGEDLLALDVLRGGTRREPHGGAQEAEEQGEGGEDEGSTHGGLEGVQECGHQFTTRRETVAWPATT